MRRVHGGAETLHRRWRGGGGSRVRRWISSAEAAAVWRDEGAERAVVPIKWIRGLLACAPDVEVAGIAAVIRAPD